MCRVLMVIGLAIFLTGLVSSCSRDDSVSRLHSFKLYEENGVTIAETSGGPKFPGFLFSFEQYREIHPPESIEESLLAQLAGFTRDEAGNYFIADRIRSDPRIVVFNPSGEFLRTIGSVGDGPGEFRRPVLQGIRGNVLEVFDEGLLRVSHFDTSGVFLITIPLFGRLSRMEAMYYSIQGHQIVVQYVIDLKEEDQWLQRICTIFPPDGTAEIVLKTPQIKDKEGKITSLSPRIIPSALNRNELHGCSLFCFKLVFIHK